MTDEQADRRTGTPCCVRTSTPCCVRTSTWQEDRQPLLREDKQPLLREGFHLIIYNAGLCCAHVNVVQCTR